VLLHAPFIAATAIVAYTKPITSPAIFTALHVFIISMFF